MMPDTWVELARALCFLIIGAYCGERLFSYWLVRLSQRREGVVLELDIARRQAKKWGR